MSGATGRPVGRRRSRLRDLPLIGWLAAAVVIAVAHRWLPDANWLMLHLVLLGALTHAIVVWSFHFAQTLLRSPASEAEAVRHNRRLGLLTAGAAAVLIGVPTTWWPLTLGGGTLVAVAVGWHGLVLWGMLRRALPARFRVTVRYYLGAAASLLVGIVFGVLLALGWEDPWHGRLLVAHALANVLGWVGLTLTGTLLTLWPTMLRTRMDDVAERWTQQALPVFGAAIAVSVGGALAGLGWLAAAGVGLYLVALGLWGRGLWRPARTRPPREFASASVGAALVWLVIGLGWAGALLATAPDWTAVREGFIWPAAVLGAGFAVQVLSGALSYLLPSVLGGGPSVVRAGQRWFNRAGAFRLIAINGGVALWLLPTPSWVKVTGSLLALGAATAFLPLMILGLKASIAARRELAAAAASGAERTPSAPLAAPTATLAGEPEGPGATNVPTPQARPGRPPVGAAGPGHPERGRPEPERPSIFTAGQLIAGLTALATAVVVGVGVDPTAAGAVGAAPSPAVAVQPTGKVVRVEVAMGDMKFTPSSVTVRAGDTLVLDLVNTDTTTHDVTVGAARSARIGPGKRAELDVGVVGASIQGYCTVAGHRQMGMVFDVIVEGAPQATAQPSATTSGTGHEGHPNPAPSASLASDQIVDPVLPPLTSERVHKLTLTVQEVPLQVAPGVWQRRWTYNGRPIGPTLHGRVGDVFEITLVNDGSMGHSIDFHAGALAPDRPMRTIEPGERLVYRFTATKAGVWMYHCSTHPMSAHIAAGMAGAVVIEPDGLPRVDRSYVLVQSEAYLADRALMAETATEVDADAVGSRNPDYVMFNGVANGYDQHRLAARVGERVRFWVLDVGPNRASSFHIVGTQFDTVFSEGSYLLKRGRDAFGGRSGGAQALGLQPAQGGFVETVFPEAGNYALVSHIMSDAERGAHGFVHVTGG
ncbi:MAG: multicopper oxidase domain-containing protein [Micropruina sp.]|uniref:multicopper oxidase domain-containing protein n=1 Tax=Micropruina sp. TaxID=2737536 RepID=UPI0039E26D31